MAEERIYIGKINWQEPLGFCPVPMGECNNFCEKCQGGMTRLDAIERIAEALCRKDSGIKSCHECIHNGTASCGYTLNKWFAEDAEAALNALLEEQNDR